MIITVEATYENGVLRPAEPLPLKEHEKVRVSVLPQISRARRTAGLMGWTGSAEVADYFGLDPELSFSPLPEKP